MNKIKEYRGGNAIPDLEVVEFWKDVKFYRDNVERVLREYQANLEFWELYTGRKRF